MATETTKTLRERWIAWAAGIAILGVGVYGLVLLLAVRHDPPKPNPHVLAAPELPAGPPEVTLPSKAPEPRR